MDWEMNKWNISDILSLIYISISPSQYVGYIPFNHLYKMT